MAGEFCAVGSEFAAPKFDEFSAWPEFVPPKVQVGVLLFAVACDVEPKANGVLLLLFVSCDVGVAVKLKFTPKLEFPD